MTRPFCMSVRLCVFPLINLKQYVDFYELQYGEHSIEVTHSFNHSKTASTQTSHREIVKLCMMYDDRF